MAAAAGASPTSSTAAAGAYLSFGTALDWPAAPATRRLGASTRRPPRSPERSAATLPPWKTPVLVVDPVPGRLAVLGGVALGGIRRQRRAVLPELRGGPGRALVGPRPPSPVRGRRPPPLDGSPDLVGAPACRGLRRRTRSSGARPWPAAEGGETSKPARRPNAWCRAAPSC